MPNLFTSAFRESVLGTQGRWGVIFFGVSSSPVPAIATTTLATLRLQMHRNERFSRFINGQHDLNNGNLDSTDVLFVVGPRQRGARQCGRAIQ